MNEAYLDEDELKTLSDGTIGPEEIKDERGALKKFEVIDFAVSVAIPLTCVSG